MIKKYGGGQPMSASAENATILLREINRIKKKRKEELEGK